MRAAQVAMFGVVLALAVSARADAAMLLRIYVEPALPRAGVPARVSVVTLAPTSKLCAWDPAASHVPNATWYPSAGELELRMVAESPERTSIAVSLARRASDGAWWDGAVTFPEPGRWTLRVIYPSWSDEDCGGARRAVEVVSVALPGTSTRAPQPSAIAAAFGVLGAAALFARRRARRAVASPRE